MQAVDVRRSDVALPEPTRPGDDATAVRLLQKRASPVLLIDCCSFPNCGYRKLKGRPHRRASAVMCVCVWWGRGGWYT